MMAGKIVPSHFLHPDEDVHDITRNGLYLIQKKDGYRYTMDAVLLADFARISEKALVADFGGGSGVISLLLHARGKGCSYYSFEILTDYVDMAMRTARLNQITHLFHPVPLPVGMANMFIGRNTLDAIVSNPPYYLPNQYLTPKDDTQATSRAMQRGTLKEWLKMAYGLLRGKGTISIVYPAERMMDALAWMEQASLMPKRIRLVHPMADRPANLVMLEGVKDGRPSLRVEPPLIVRDRSGAFSQEMTRIYGFAPTAQQGAPHGT